MDIYNVDFKICDFYELNNDEIYEIAKARYEVFACEQKITCENDFDDRDKGCHHLLVNYNGKLAGYCRILKVKEYDNSFSIGRVLVLKEYRRKNIAQEMLERAVSFIVNELEEDRIIISGQLYVKKLYESVGFKQISDIYDEAGIPHIKLQYTREK